MIVLQRGAGGGGYYSYGQCEETWDVYQGRILVYAKEASRRSPQALFSFYSIKSR